MSRTVTIKKYANRRLYDTGKSEYVTLKDVGEMVKEGKQVKVINAKTKEDVTAFILTQIILDGSRGKNALLPVSLLHLIIRYGENILSEFFDKYLELTIKNYLAYKTAVDEQFRKWLDLGMDLTNISQKALMNLPAFKPFLDLFPESQGDNLEEKKTKS